MSLNKSMYGYFVSHPGVNEFWFCSDGLAFFTATAAQAHAVALKKAGKSDTVLAVTKADITAWWATYAPQYAATCATDVATAQASLTNAEQALSALPAKTPFSKKASYIKAVNDASKRLALAQTTLIKANADAQYLADQSALAAAQGKLNTDAAAQGTPAATLDADKAAVDAAAAKLEADKNTPIA